MNRREFKVQVIETAAQWNTGVRSGLDFGPDGLSLFLVPAFDSWLIKQKGAFADIVVDQCGQTYWTELPPKTSTNKDPVWQLVRHNPLTGLVETVLSFSGCSRLNPRELWLTKDYLWIFDHDQSEPANLSTGRMLGLSRDTYQIVEEFVIEGVVDIDADPEGNFFYALTRQNGETQLCRYVTFQQQSSRIDCFKLKDVTDATVLAVGKDGNVYIVDTGAGKLIRFDPRNQEQTDINTSQGSILKGFKATAMQADSRGVIFLASSDPARLHMFDADGSYLGELELPTGVTKITGIGFDGRGGVYLSTDAGLARFTLTKNPIGHEGVFYSRTLDNGERESFWHRIALKGNLPVKSSAEVYYYSSDSVALREAVDKVFNDPHQSVEQKSDRLDSLLGGSWIGPETFKASSATDLTAIDSPDLILDPNKGRFLWFKIKLKTFDQKSRPTIRSARIYYPRLSYLRYLPPAYREEPLSAAFLERFLSIFETTFEGLDQEIDQLFRYFDPTLAPKDFLPWLGSWINISLDEDLPESRIRQLIQRAPFLYSRKGTAASLTEFLKIYTGKPVYVSEYWNDRKPMVLGLKEWSLGSGLALLGSGPRGMRIGHSTVVGYAAVRDRVSDPDEPFLPLARRFAVVINMDRNEFEKKKSTLQRIILEQSPVHTSFTMRTTNDQTTLGRAVLGISAVVQGPQPYRIGLTQLGSGSALASGPQAVRIERGAWVGSSGRL